MKPYCYAIIKESYPELEHETVLDPSSKANLYRKNKKYAMIVKGVHKDHSESIYYIKYSNDIVDLHSKAKDFISWYNYPLGICKSIQGFLSTI